MSILREKETSIEEPENYQGKEVRNNSNETKENISKSQVSESFEEIKIDLETMKSFSLFFLGLFCFPVWIYFYWKNKKSKRFETKFYLILSITGLFSLLFVGLPILIGIISIFW